MQKLSFKTYSHKMIRETLSSAILSRKFQMILFSRQNHILPLILYFQKKERKLQKVFLHLQKMYLHLHLHLHLQKKGRKSQKTFLHLQKMYLHLQTHWRQSRHNLTLQIKEVNKEELWKASQCI